MVKRDITIDPRDNVGVALLDRDGIPAGHKFALRDIEAGEFVVKYGCPIGRASADIKKGEWVHTHNLRSHLDERAVFAYEFAAASVPPQKRVFSGYKRKAGRAGVRNEIYIIPTVGCVNNVCRRLEREAQSLVRGSIDSIFALTHPFGCSQLGDDGENIKKLLCGIALNPNATKVLFVGLGCENNGLDGIKKYLGPYGRDNIGFFNCQDADDEHACGMEILRRFAAEAAELKREETDFSELAIGLKCGGSDGFSGLTANPVVGKVTDRVVSCGGSAVLTEIPETFGAEQILMNKCKSRGIFEKLCALEDRYKAFYTSNGFPVYENPSPGNRRGGITTLEEKSLGCVEKAGHTAITDVLNYGEQLREHGVSILDAPGNDLIASTALAASGCQLVLFTTGRGTPFSTFVPTLKIASNAPLARKKDGWIDFDASGMDDEALFGLVCATASGQYRCKSEDIREIAFYKTGVTL